MRFGFISIRVQGFEGSRGQGNIGIHDDTSLLQSVIPGLTRNPVFSWIPAFPGMTPFTVVNVAVYKT